MTNQIVPVEPVLAQTNGLIIRGKLNVRMGRYELTGSHLTFFMRSRIFMMFGALGALLSFLSKGKQELVIELSQITSIARSKYGLNKKILDVTLADGKVHRLGLDKFDDFTAALRDQLTRRNGSVKIQLTA